MLRSASTRWFEVLCPRLDGVSAVAALARTGAVEIEPRGDTETDPWVQCLARDLAAYQALLPRYGRYWARGARHRRALAEAPAAILERALAAIGAWRREADPLIDLLQSCEEELTRLKSLAQIIERISASPLDFAAAARSGPVLGTFCAILPRDAGLKLSDLILPRSVPWEDERCYMFLGPRSALEHAKYQVQSLKGRIIERPSWLMGDAHESLGRIRARREFLSIRVVNLQAELDSLFEDYDLDHRLAAVEGLAWFAEHVGGLQSAGAYLVWATGWTDDLGGDRLQAALEESQTRSILRLRPPPAGKRPPQVLENPPWVRPFEGFAKAFGVPGGDETDPSPVLALVVPLLFGYMFGDLGQGAVLAGVGWWLLRRGTDLGRILILCGISGMFFGLLFGSLFAREDLIPALWLQPLEEPLPVLTVPLVFAVVLLSLGQLLDGRGALWRGALSHWLMKDLGFLVLYLGIVAAATGSNLGWLAPVGAIWYLVGAFLVHRELIGGLAAIGHLLESGMQILVNTLSFARVGAFALAHASLSAAVVTMADAAPTGAGLLILVAGNLLIILLEGLVVSIQTTRLVLFEFFNRFLRGTGRVFRPLPPPPEVSEAVS